MINASPEVLDFGNEVNQRTILEIFMDNLFYKLLDQSSHIYVNGLPVYSHKKIDITFTHSFDPQSATYEDRSLYEQYKDVHGDTVVEMITDRGTYLVVYDEGVEKIKDGVYKTHNIDGDLLLLMVVMKSGYASHDLPSIS